MATIRDKTLVVWAYPANLEQRGGSALTLDDRQSHFDGVVFGEIAPGRWMAGSDAFRRTQREQGSYPVETAGPEARVQVAVVTRGNEAALYRNGKEVTRYAIGSAQEYGPESVAVFGLRHLEAGDRACFAGAIEDARVYDRALDAAQIAALEPGKASEPFETRLEKGKKALVVFTCGMSDGDVVYHGLTVRYFDTFVKLLGYSDFRSFIIPVPSDDKKLLRTPTAKTMVEEASRFLS